MNNSEIFNLISDVNVINRWLEIGNNIRYSIEMELEIRKLKRALSYLKNIKIEHLFFQKSDVEKITSSVEDTVSKLEKIKENK